MAFISNIKTITRRLLLCVALCATASIALWAQGVEVATERDTDNERQTEVVRPYSDKEAERIYSRVSPLGIKYTKKHPLVIAMDWAFPPFSYYDDDGNAKGMLISIIKQVFSRYHLPYQVKMMPRQNCYESLAKEKSDLIIDIDNLPKASHMHRGRTVVADYNVAVVRNKSTKMMRSIMLLDKTDTVMVIPNSYSYYYILEYFRDSVPFTFELADPSYAMNAILSSAGSSKYFVWDEVALQSLVRKYNVNNEVKIERIDVPQGHLRFYSTDSVLLHELDLTVQQMQQTGQYETSYETWSESDTIGKRTLSIEVVIFALLIIAIGTLIFLLLRTTIPNRLKREFRTMTGIGVDSANCQLIAVSVKKGYCYNISGKLIPKNGISLRELMALASPDDVYKMLDAKNKIDNGLIEIAPIQVRMKHYGDPVGRWYNMIITGSVKMNGKKPVYIYMVLHDETEHKDEQLLLTKALREYSSITDISNVGRAYYDNRGRLTKVNDNLIAYLSKGGSDRVQAFLKETTLHELCIKFNGIMLEDDMDMYFGTIIDIPEINFKAAAEIRLRTVWSDEHHNDGYVMTIHDRDVAQALYGEFKDAQMNLNTVNKSLQKYHNELRFIMQRNKMYPFKWQVGNDYIEVSVNDIFDTHVSFEEYVSRVEEKDKADILAALSMPQKYITQPIHTIRQLNGAYKSNQAGWYDVHLMPDYDAQGRYVGVFGIRYDITNLVETQEKLRVETEKALDSGRQKTVFLSNMTHELRTPLNAINGFAEIMSFLTTDEEKKEYIDIMDHNCTMLISLVDNILHLSTIDTEGLKIRKRHVDFAKEFRQAAEDMRKYINNPEVSYRIDTPMQTLMLDIDAERIMQMLDIVVNNAAKFTQKGFIHIGFRYDDSCLTVYCRDTGCGIANDKQQEIFNRFMKVDEFVQGMGLGLALCKAIADIMGARLDIYSREGEGTSVSITLDMRQVFE